MDKEIINLYVERILDYFSNNFSFLNLNDLENKGLYLLSGIIILLFLIFFRFLKFKKKKNRVGERKNFKPILSDIVDSDPEINSVKNNDNDFVDVLVAIEEEMAAVRELYVGGYITKGIYISETDRLYEKAKVFGL